MFRRLAREGAGLGRLKPLGLSPCGTWLFYQGQFLTSQFRPPLYHRSHHPANITPPTQTSIRVNNTCAGRRGAGKDRSQDRPFARASFGETPDSGLQSRAGTQRVIPCAPGTQSRPVHSVRHGKRRIGSGARCKGQGARDTAKTLHRRARGERRDIKVG